MAEPGDGRWRLRHLPLLLAVSGIVLVAAALVGWAARGGVGALGAALGVAIVTVSYTLSTLVIAWADAVSPRLVLPFGLAVYAAKFTVLGVAMAVLASSGWPGLVPLGCGVVAGVIGWTAAHVWWITSARAAPRRQGARS